MTIYYHMYSKQYGKNLEVDLIGSKQPTKTGEKILISYCLSQGLNMPLPHFEKIKDTNDSALSIY